MRNLSPMVTLFIMLMILATPLQADAAKKRKTRTTSPFAEGKTTLSLSGGFAGDSGSFGGGIGYFMISGLELYVDGRVWFRNDQEPIGAVGPGVRYIFWRVPNVHPYAGTFVRRWFQPGDDVNTLGFRAGAVTRSTGIYFSAGLAYERVLSCNPDLMNCTEFYPEATIGISF